MIKLFGASWCNPCKQAKKWLLDHNIAFEYIDVESGHEDVEKYNIMSVPTIVKEEMIITGFQEAEYKEKLL